MTIKENFEFERVDKIKEIFALTSKKINNRIITPDINFDFEGVVYITGFSGTGKTSLIKKFKKLYQDYEEPTKPLNEDIPIIELVGKDIEDAIRILGQVGLTEAFIYLTPYKYLSDGQKTRFLLANILMKKPKIVVIDEFLSNVDRITAKSVAYNFQKICRKNNINVIVATAHNDLVEALAPDILVNLDFNGVYEVKRKPIEKAYIPELKDTKIQIGSITDYNKLKRFHYFGDNEMSNEFDINYFVYRYKKTTIGVTIYKSPYPKEWNEIEYFREINDKLRVVINTIIHPSFRGIGLSLNLLKTKLSKYNYYVVKSALGIYMPRELSAGYTKIEIPSNLITQLRRDYENLLIQYGVENLNELHNEEFCIDFIRSINNAKKKELRKLAINLFAENLMNTYLFYRDIVELNRLNNYEIYEIKEFFLEVTKSIRTEVLLQENVYFKMQGFSLKINK